MSVECSLAVLMLLDLRKHLSVASVCTGSSRLLAARLGDKCSDKPQLRRQLARGVRPVLATTRSRGQVAGVAGQPSERILIRHTRGMRSGSKSVRRPGYRRHVSDRGCPLGTGCPARCGTRVARLVRTNALTMPEDPVERLS
jgi:hypothetical protein